MCGWHRVAPTIVILSMLATPAFGQSNQIDKIVLQNSTLDRESENVRNAVEIVTGRDSSTVSLKLSGNLSDTGGANAKKRFSAWSVTAAAPLDKNDSDTELATLDGLAKGFSIEWKFNQYIAHPKDPYERGEDTPEAKLSNAICAQAKQAFIAKRVQDALPANRAAAREAAERDWFCDQNRVKTFVKARYNEWRNLYWDLNKNKVFRGLAIKAGYDDFDYLDPTSGAKADTQEVSYSGKLYYGWIPGVFERVLVFEGKHQASSAVAGNPAIIQLA